MGNYDFDLDLESQNTMSVINQWILPQSQVLEFGPANGRLTRHLSQNKKCEVTIVEIDVETGKEASQYAKQSFIGEDYGNIEKYYWDNAQEKYDYIVFADVLEHLRDPGAVLARCKKHLKPQGEILVSIPNITHNSIIIDMLNDEFEYGKVGLLDSTHVHFFSCTSFCRMIQSCGIGISEMISIYSRVGDNEISNSYLDVPIEIEQYLRKREEGSVYQYVFRLQAEDGEGAVQVKGLETERYGTLETQCFYKENAESHYQDECKITKTYFENETVNFEIDLGQWQDVRQIRWDPLEYNGIIFFNQCRIQGQNIELKVANTNAYLRRGNLFIFDSEDPWIEFEELQPEYGCEKVLITFRVLAYRRDASYYRNLFVILEQFGDGGEAEYFEKAFWESQIQELKEYAGRLEDELRQIKLYCGEQKNQKGFLFRRIANKIEKIINKG